MDPRIGSANRATSRQFPFGPGVMALATALLLLMVGSVQAQKSWTSNGAAGPIFGGANNWSPAGSPSGAGVIAYFTNTFNNGYIITFNLNVTLGRIVFNNPPNLSDLNFLKHTTGDYVLALNNDAASPVINVATPLANWTVLSSGAFGPSAVTYTDTSATNAKRFYRIKSP
jgi:hypothetical protein